MSTTSYHVPANFSSIVAVPAVPQRLDTCQVFQVSHDDSLLSPIDQFIVNTLPLNRSWLTRDPQQEFERHEGLVLVLGYVSAVESYMRALIRRVLLVDPVAQKTCQTKVVTYAAACVSKPELLPEALMEEHVFSGEDHVTQGLSKFLAVEVKDAALKDLIEQYGDICHIRHCCVHRFGKLGAKNAVGLGLERHRALIDKPVLLDYRSVETIAALLTTMVKSINNHVMGEVLRRSVTSLPREATSIWTWNARKDAPTYRKYYNIFASTKDASPSASMSTMYRTFKLEFETVANNIAQRAARATSNSGS